MEIILPGVYMSLGVAHLLVIVYSLLGWAFCFLLFDGKREVCLVDFCISLVAT